MSGMTAQPRERLGRVLKNKMQKTVVVEVIRKKKNAKYLKAVRQRIRYLAHDETSMCQVGDRVLLEETRPLSKTKRWRVKSVVEKAMGAV